MRKLVIFNYDTKFIENIKRTILEYNNLYPDDKFLIDIYRAGEYLSESAGGSADFIIHSGGDGLPVEEDLTGIPKFYICHSHQWKAKLEGGKVIRLENWRKGIHFIDILEDDEILGRKGKLPIMQYHSLAVVQAPPKAKILATSKYINTRGEEIEILEALRYPDGSISVQGHPEEGTASHIIYNYFTKTKRLPIPTELPISTL